MPLTIEHRDENNLKEHCIIGGGMGSRDATQWVECLPNGYEAMNLAPSVSYTRLDGTVLQS